MSLAPPIPADDIERVAQLRDLMVLDSEPEAVFDAIARLASELCSTPIALISLVDAERQWVKASVGLTDVRETPRELAFCAHAIHADEVFEVQDAARDPRFSDHLLVTSEPHIAFYAGAPMLLPGGARIGTLCVMDSQARRLSEAQSRALQSLAALAVHSLVMRRQLLDHRPLGTGNRPTVQSIGHDGSEQREAVAAQARVQIELQHQTALLHGVMDAIPAMVAIYDAEERIRYVNRALERTVGQPREHIIGCKPAEVFGAEVDVMVQPMARRALAGETVAFEHTLRTGGRVAHLALSFIPLHLDGGAVDGFVGVAQDITQHREEEVRLLQLAQRDALTGLLNRAGFEHHLDGVIAQGAGANLALLYIDLDNFKPINDTHGHAVGDGLLQQLASRLRALVRPTDAVARLGGDEFAIALVGLPDAAYARMVADQVLAAAHEPFVHRALTLCIGASVGVAFGAESLGGWRALVERADALLYRAKAGGRGRQMGE